jgi:iron(III) transport system ATP-binding protein
MTTEISVELRAICKEFPGAPGAPPVQAVDHVSLAVRRGELVTLLGPSGCGKTTTLRIIGGFEYPTSGEVLLGGKSIGALPPNLRETCMVFQSYALFPHMDVYDNVAYGLRVRKFAAGAELEKRVRRVLDLVGLVGFEHRGAGQLSGGQQQRVALARALVVEPKVLLFDEPLSNLDAQLRIQMRDEIRRLRSELGFTAIYVTHDQEEAMSLSDRIVVMNKGRIEQAGPPHEVYTRPCSRFVADFIGKKANFVPARVVSTGGGVLTVEALGARLSWPGEEWSGSVPRPGLAANMVLLVVRPEAVELVAGGEGGEGDPQGVVRKVTYLGDAAIYEVEVAGRTLTVQAANPALQGLFTPGTRLTVRLRTRGMHLLPAEEAGKESCTACS